MALARHATSSQSWVRRVRETSDAMDLPKGIFKRTPAEIARGLRRSALRSTRTKGTKFQSAMAMLNLYVNRAGRTLSERDRTRLAAAKRKLREAFGRKPTSPRRARSRRKESQR